MILGIEILSLVLTVCYAALILFYYLGWRRTIYFSEKIISGKTRVSVVVAVRNEAKNIRESLMCLLSQDYPQEMYEVIFVDDHSEDATVKILNSYSISNLKVLQLKDFHPARENGQNAFKKEAIALGIKHSNGELIITTDGDCSIGTKWLSAMVSFYESYQPKLFAAPVAFQDEKSFLEKWQSLDFMGLMGITAGAITNNFPNMCNGANLAYEKKAFEEVGGFEGVENIPTGDDILLLLKIKNLYPDGVKFLKSKDAIVYTKPQPSFAALISQRLRWVSKSTSFSDKRITAVLVMAYFFNLFIILNFFVGIFFDLNLLWVSLISLTVKMIVEFPLFWEASGFFKKRKLLSGYLPAQILHIFYVVLIGMGSRVFSYNWKGRVVETKPVRLVTPP